MSERRLDAGVALATAASLALVAWWLGHSAAVRDYDTSKHIGFALNVRSDWLLGHPFQPLHTDFTGYPPLGHLVAGLGLLIAGPHVAVAVFSVTLVFLPLTVLGIYGTGAAIQSRAAGALAVVFALGAPLLISQERAFMLELPMTGCVAVMLWALVRSRRFADARWAALAGVAAGAGMMAKPDFPVFAGGVVVVALARGGWRHWRGWLAFLAVAALLSAPWYLDHLHQLRTTTAYATASASYTALSKENLTWFAWQQVNWQLFLPLLLVLIGGLVATVAGWWRRRPGAGDWTPELVGALVVAYLGLTFSMKQHAAYYALPMLPFEALLATGWIAAASGQRRRWAGAALVATIALFNTVIVSVYGRANAGITFPGAARLRDHDVLNRRRLVVARSYSWPVGPPTRRGDVLGLLRRARRDGVRVLEVAPGTDLAYFNPTGVALFGRLAGLGSAPPGPPGALAPDAVLIDRGPHGCASLEDGTDVTLTRGRPPHAYCPP